MSTPPQPVKKPRRWKRMPLLDENGEYAVIFEYRPVTCPLVQERFVRLTGLLYQKWVLEPRPFPKRTPPTATDPTTTKDIP